MYLANLLWSSLGEGVFDDDSGIISSFLHKILDTQKKHLGEGLLMSTHNTGFYGEIRKIIPELSPNSPPDVQDI